MRLHRSLPLLAALCLVIPAPAWAGDTAHHPGAHGPEPVGGILADQESVVQLLSEHLDVRFGRETTTVSVQLLFRNTAKQGATRQLLGFPDIAAARQEALRRDPEAAMRYPYRHVSGSLAHQQTLVNDWAVPTKLQYGYVKEGTNRLNWQRPTPEDSHLMAWHVAWVDFPAGRDVAVERRYQVKNGLNADGVAFFEYLTHTGRIWHGPIGRLVVDVTLADGLTIDDLIWKGRPLPKGIGSYETGFHTRPDHAEWKVLSPTRLQLRWQDFEPYLGSPQAGLVLSTPTKR